MQHKKTEKSIKKDKSSTQPNKKNNNKKTHKKDISWYAALFTVIAGIYAVISFFGIPTLTKLLNIDEAIDVSRSLDMTAYDAINYLKFDKYRTGEERLYYTREGGVSYLECDYDYIENRIPSCWNMFIMDDDYSLYGIIVNKTTIEETNKIMTQKGWYIEDSDMNLYNDPSKDVVEYMMGTELSKFINFKLDKGIVTEIQIYYLEWGT